MPSEHEERAFARTIRSTPSMRESEKDAFRRTQTRVVGSARGSIGEPIPDVGAIIGNYVLVKKLGEGAHGAVYLAHRVGLEQQRVALKVIPSTAEHIAIVRQELVTLATVVHPNIVQLSDHGTEGNFAWFTMPFYEGVPLDHRLGERFRKGETLSVEEAYETFLPLVGALAALHAAGFRHQDIKPENIFLGRFADKEHPILLDLGVAVTKDNQKFLAGTREYFAPEQLDTFAMHLGLKQMDPAPVLSEAMDVYSFAATLLLAILGPEHIPGARMFRMEEMDLSLEEMWKTIEAAQRQREVEPIPSHALKGVRGPARRELEESFRRWFSRDPKKRPGAPKMAKELSVLLARRTQSERRRRTAMRVALGATTILLVGAPVAYAGGKYAVSLKECKDRVAEDAHKTGLVAANLQDCQMQAAALMQSGSECETGLSSEKALRASGERELETKLAASKAGEAKVQGLLDGEKAKLSVVTAEKTKCDDAQKACLAAKTDVETKLTASQESLTKSQDALTKCTTDLTKQTADATKLGGEVAALTKEKGEVAAQLASCKEQVTAAAAVAGELKTCKAELQSTSSDDAACKKQLASCPTALTTCQAGLATCTSALAACKAKPAP